MPFVKARTVDEFREPDNAPVRTMPRADICIVFPYKPDARIKYSSDSNEVDERSLRPPTAKEATQMDIWKQKRHGVITALSDAGLILMPFYSRDRDEIFVKISVDEIHLRQVAEMLRYKLELKPEFFSAFAEYKIDYAGRRENHYSDRRVVSHLYKVHVDPLIDQNGNVVEETQSEYPRPDAIFRTTDRITLVDHIVKSADHKCAAVDIGQLLQDENIKQYFPLHENAKLVDLGKDWFRCFVSGQHIDKVRNYFGERIAMYFLFMAHFNTWLVLPAFLGPVKWLLDWCSRNLFPMLIHHGEYAQKYLLIAFALLMGTWATFFIHVWRMKAATFALRWGTLGMTAQLEPTRPKATGTSRVNPITGRPDRHFPWAERVKAVAFSTGVLGVTIIVLLIWIGILFALRHRFHKAVGGRIVFQIINAISVEIINAIFTKVAKWLTDLENHRTDSEVAYHMMAKSLVFKFFNCYSSLYYIAFFKEHGHLWGMEMTCIDDNCLQDLGQQLLIFMLIRLILMNMVEIGLPAAKTWYRNWSEGRTFHTSLFTNPLTVMPDLSSAEKQSKKDTYDLYEDMDEILILFGYSTLFVVSCPWVPLIALLSTVFECFLDQKKLLMLYQRPFPMPAANNEPWDTAFDVVGVLAMMTNLAVVIFATHAFNPWNHHQKIMLWLAVEHFFIVLRLLVQYLKPALPREVRILQMQQRVIVHRHLNLQGEEDNHEARTMAMRNAAGTPLPPIYDQDDEQEEFL